MAVVSVKNLSTLKLKFDCGLNNLGKVIIKTKSLSNVKPEASDDDLFQVAKALSDLQEHTLFDVIVVDSTTISE